MTEYCNRIADPIVLEAQDCKSCAAHSGLSGVTTVTDIMDDYPIVPSENRTVAVFNTENNASEGYQETNFYVSKHIGIVRKELLDDNEIWNLIEYEVIQ